ncbi:MAG: hypothetical protein Udaeo_10410 [Candidatus Udaeobacter sp.]|nr:MAG: hypothetical protein Udaeo_10410 [Candidatus Udaeobacter sp.]
MHNVADRIWIHRAQFPIPLHFHILQKLPDLGIFESLRLELAIGDFAVNQRDGRDVGQTVIRRLARFGFPFFRFAPNDVDRSIVALDHHTFDFREVVNLAP